MANLKFAYGSTQTLTVTNLHSLASSATTAWASAIIDNTSDLYEDALVQVVLDFANTAPANDACAYVFAYGGIESGVYSNPVSGSEGTVTLTTIVSNPQAFRQIGIIPYTTQNEVAESQPMSVAGAFGGVLAPYWGIVVVNYSGAALAASANTAKWRGVYRTVI
jgi:hypothetical protein